MPKTLPDIIYNKATIEKNIVTPIIDAKASYYQIPYNKDNQYFTNYESYVNFIKGCERLVRQNDKYSKYINYLKKEVKLDRCQVLKNVTDLDADIEMHHGPIFTLFDICSIVLEYFLIKKWKISTARITDAVLKEHQANRIQVVMVSATIHEEIHNGDIFINYHQAFGDIKAFLRKYDCALSNEMREQVNRYIDKSLLRDSSDFGILELNKELIKK